MNLIMLIIGVLAIILLSAATIMIVLLALRDGKDIWRELKK